MKKIRLGVFLSLLFTTAAWANFSDYVCPSVNEIKNIGFDKNDIFNDKGHYLVSRQNEYNTGYLWTFRVEDILATNADDAFNKANLALNTLSGDPQPEYANGYMYCTYKNQNSYWSYAFTKAFLKTTITIKPNHPESWGYINASVSINQKLNIINNGITVPTTVDSNLSIADVAAMNVHPKIDASCFNIQLTEGDHKLLFELTKDWFIHCQYS